MGTSKKELYSEEELSTALVGRAIGHAARLHILRKIEPSGIVTNKQVAEELMLDKATVHDHVLKMIEADLVDYEYYEKFAVIFRTDHHRELTRPFCQ